MKRIISLILVISIAMLSACDYQKDDLSSEVTKEPFEENVSSNDTKNQIWYEFKGKVTSVDENGIYTIYDTIRDFPYKFIMPLDSSMPSDDFSVGDSVRLFVLDDEGLYNVDEENVQTLNPDMILRYDEPTEVFFAKVPAVYDKSLYIKGLDVNPRRYSGSEYIVNIADKTSLTQYGMSIELSEIAPDDIISVHFSGEITETYPAGIHDVIRIEKIEKD